MDVLTVEQRRKNMQAIKSSGGKEEVMLAKALWARGWRYRKNDRSVLGKPDICFKRFKLAVFVDSEYFHGKNWGKEKYRIKTNRRFWWKKIENNILRDRTVNKGLRKNGWIVLRFWTTSVRKNLASCIDRIEKKIRERNGYVQSNKSKA